MYDKWTINVLTLNFSTNSETIDSTNTNSFFKWFYYSNDADITENNMNVQDGDKFSELCPSQIYWKHLSDWI